MELPYLNMASKVQIGNVRFTNVNAIEIEQSVTELSRMAKVIIPRHYKELDGKPMLSYIHVGDKVAIDLGYEETGLNREFVGYVREIGSSIPIEISCDELYPLRQNNHVKSYLSVTLKQLLSDVTTGTFIKKIECPDVQLGKYQIDNASTYQVLEKMKEELGLYARINDSVLRMAWAWDWQPNKNGIPVYTIQENVRSNDLKYKRKDAFNVKVRVKIRNKKGKAEYYETGSKDKNATVTTIEYAADNGDAAKKIADARLQKSVYEGYTGSITGFGIPLTQAGDSLKIIDKGEPEHEGTYLIEKVNISYSNGGFKRTNSLAYKL